MKAMMPESEVELARMVAEAEGPLRIVGGGTRAVGCCDGAVLSVAGLSGIDLYEPGALTLVARAGTPVAEIEAALAKEGQRLAFEVPDMRGLLGRSGASTIGGVVAANASGPCRVQGGACRDFLLGVRFVDGAGQVVSNGGRVMKNVTGYDLVKLMAGAHGTLGVLSEVSFKVLPVPERALTLACDGLDTGDAVAAMSAALGAPFDVTGAAHRGGLTFVRLEGFAESVAYRAGALAAALSRFGDWAEVADPWAGIRDVAGFHDQAGDVWRVSVKPSDAPGVIAQAGAEDAMMDWGGGLIWLRMAAGTDLRARLGDVQGHATLVRGAPDTVARLGAFHPEPAAVAALTRGLRARFDPRNILNRGLMA